MSSAKLRVGDARDLGAFIPAALDDWGLDVYEIRVYVRLCRRAGSGQCWESISSMAEGCKMSRPTVIKALANLVEKGFIKIENRHRETGQSNVYTILPIPAAPPESTEPHSPSKGDLLGVVNEVDTPSKGDLLPSSTSLTTLVNPVDSKGIPGRVSHEGTPKKGSASPVTAPPEGSSASPFEQIRAVLEGHFEAIGGESAPTSDDVRKHLSGSTKLLALIDAFGVEKVIEIAVWVSQHRTAGMSWALIWEQRNTILGQMGGKLQKGGPTRRPDPVSKVNADRTKPTYGVDYLIGNDPEFVPPARPENWEGMTRVQRNLWSKDHEEPPVIQLDPVTGKRFDADEWERRHGRRINAR